MVTDVDGLRTRYVREGAGDPVLVLPGWAATIEAVAPITKGLAGQNTVYALDLPGFGETAPPPEPWGVADYVRFVLRFAESLELDRVSVIGHSHGGRVAIMLAAEHPERVDKMVLVDSAGIKPKRGLRYYRRVALAKVGKYAARFLGAPGRRLRERIVGRVASSDYASTAPELRATFVRVVNEDLRHLLPRIEASTLLIWGGADTDTPVENGRLMEELIPDAGLVVFEGAGHYSYVDEPARFNRVVAHFLAPVKAEA